MKDKKQAELEEKLSQKDLNEIGESFLAFTVLALLKSNTEKYLIPPEKQSQMLFSTMLILIVTTSMLWCMIFEIFRDGSEFDTHMTHSFALFFVKYPCALALHIILYPEVSRGMMIMKYANNQPESFVRYGSEIAFMIGFIQATLAIVAEFINILLLAF